MPGAAVMLTCAGIELVAAKSRPVRVPECFLSIYAPASGKGQTNVERVASKQLSSFCQSLMKQKMPAQPDVSDTMQSQPRLPPQPPVQTDWQGTWQGRRSDTSHANRLAYGAGVPHQVVFTTFRDTCVCMIVKVRSLRLTVQESRSSRDKRLMEPCLCCSDVGAGHRFKSPRELMGHRSLGLLWGGVSLNDRTVWKALQQDYDTSERAPRALQLVGDILLALPCPRMSELV